MKLTDPIFVAGHAGLVGSAIVRNLTARGCVNVLTAPRAQLDLEDQGQVDRFFATHRPSHVFLAAAKVGGILANSTQPADFIRSNLTIQSNIIQAAYRHRVDKLLFLGSSCIYPKFAPQPIAEDALLSGPLEPTNEAYAIAKIAGIKMCQAYHRQHGSRFVSVMPTNLYGPGDNFALTSSHVLPALMRRFHDAKMAAAAEVTVWGSGSPLREFLHVDDLADACVFVMEEYESPEIINVGSGEELTIRALAETIQAVIGFDGALTFDPSKPDGTPRKLLNSGRLRALGWRPRIALDQGIATTYAWFLENQGAFRH
jgi:GDP-L-fucose synthase